MQELSIEALMQEGKWEDAEHASRAALQVHPTSAKLHAYLGICLFRQNKFEPAAESFKKSTLLDPNFVDAGVKHAQCLDRLQRYEEAFVVANDWLKVRPSDRTLQGIVHGLQHHVRGNRTDGWERTAHYAHRIILAQDGE
ncbi:MAG TPA: tetratricopeptide repeat protein [Fimbriimonas sp.]|nr:tetratricopeptide repeat protein [Fimbriimonas sp.]